MRLPTIKTGDRYKYRLHTLLIQLSKEDYDIALKFFPERLRIHPQTFRNWIYTLSGDNREIPGDALIVMADFFQVHPAQLFSDPIAPLSIVELFTQYKAKERMHFTYQETR